ncbi:MAG: hypothetical protein KGY61_10360, partial [Desulfobacterales bacterium]|nr:hypothetical protein [Desulfobacterales bacterium]
MTAAKASKIILNIVEFLGSDLLRWRPIFAESNSEKRPHCHFEWQREIFNNQDSSSLSFLAMTAAKASKIILNIVEFLGSPISVWRFRPSEFHVQLSTLHSSEFARPLILNGA